MQVENEEEYEGDGFKDDIDHDLVVSDRRYGGRLKEVRNREDNNLGSIKIKIQSFQGKNDPKVYLQWERNMERVFDCHNYSENK